MNLRTKSAGLLAAIVGVALATTSLVWLRLHEESLKHTIFEGLDGQAQIAAHGIAAFIEEGLADSSVVAMTLPAEALAQGRYPEVEQHLERMFAAYPKFQNGIFILDASGTFLADHPRHPELRGHSFAFREYFQRTVREQRGIVGEPYRSKRTGRPVLTFTAPVRDRAGKMVAIVACSVDLLSQEALGGYRRQRFGETGYLYVFDSARRLVLHPEDERLLTQVDAGKNAVLEAALSGFEGADETVNSRGVPMLLAVRRIARTPWIVGVQVTQREAYDAIIEARARIAVVAIGAMVLVLLVGGVAIRRVSRPLVELERAASEITTELEGGRTKGTHPPADRALQRLRGISSGDEIGLLASSFLRLAEKLRSTLRSLQDAAEGWERTFDSVNDGVVTLDPEGRIQRMNGTAQTWFRTTARAAAGQPAHAVLLGTSECPDDWPRCTALREQRKVRWTRELDGSRVLEFNFTPIGHDAQDAGAVLVVTDVTEQVESEERIREMAFFDHLTGLPNRFLLHDRLQQAMASATRSEKKAAVMFIDLDRFKEINDAYGHDVGDEVLREVVKRISACVRRNDTLSRFGGDEFVVVLQTIDDRREAALIAKRIIAAQGCPILLGGRSLEIGSSIGIAIFPDDGHDGETLLRGADAAMYQAKRRGPNAFQHFRCTLEDVRT